MPYSDPEKQKAANRQWIAEARAQGRYKVQYPVSKTRKAAYRRRHALSLLGWSPEAYEAVREQQNNACAICGKVTDLVPDHEHIEPPKPRALLCQDCNHMLGWFEKIVRLGMIKNFTQYLAKY